MIESIKKNRKGRFNYADTDYLMEAVRPILKKHQMVINPRITCSQGEVWLFTELIHAPTGQGIESYVPLKTFNDPEYSDQAAGGNITYQRRYSLMVVLNITLEGDLADDDGQSNYDRKQNRAPSNAPAFGPMITPEQIKTLNALLAGLPNGKLLEKNIMGFNKVSALSDLRDEQYTRVLNYIKDNSGK